ncbi:hypothetical protein QWT69_01325 [Sporosarcina oncorhynchi]|uniref:Cytosolic protein n=1 Tax=Sporosarcina oncorhynchi TaxID=3056444 RepID=A0ABZ0L5E0_9BACL|nr:hypothetical protein [Sporosarcina sp. T2O-4]WOV87790.1 hypothetical protein QWT69_01325 [Sporosarcina sp. T2O-4]
MTIKDGKYPNKRDLEPKVLHPGKGFEPTHELPLADPSDSNWTDDFRENAQDKTGKHEPSIYSQNKPPMNPNYHTLKPGERFPFGDQEEYNRKFNDHAHEQWNENQDKKQSKQV